MWFFVFPYIIELWIENIVDVEKLVCWTFFHLLLSKQRAACAKSNVFHYAQASKKLNLKNQYVYKWTLPCLENVAIAMLLDNPLYSSFLDSSVVCMRIGEHVFNLLIKPFK